MEFQDSYLGATFHIQWFCRSCEPWWMMSLFGPLGKATKSCCLKGSGEETLCLEKFQLQPRQPPTVSASVQHQKSKLEQRSLSARLDGVSSDPASHSTPRLQISANTRFCKKPRGSPGSSGSVCRIPPSQSCPQVPRHRETMSQQQHWRTGLRQSHQHKALNLSWAFTGDYCEFN